jgi:hypothetical protein
VGTFKIMLLTLSPDVPIKQPSVNLRNVRGSTAGLVRDKPHQQGGIHGSKESTKETG